MKQIARLYKICFLSFVFLALENHQLYGENLVQEDTLYVPDFENVPTIDASGNDACWQETRWQSIDQVWIPLNDVVAQTDFSGRFKVGWSSETNLLYFLCEVTDDIWVDGYIFGLQPGAYLFDLIEIFFDEDKSGGYHLYDYFDDQGRPVSTNSENAFSYHLAVNIPAKDLVVRDFVAVDIDGTNNYTNTSVNYASHFDSLAVIRSGNVTNWEMSLKVYNTSYGTDPVNSRVTLTEGKVSGLAVAYCDDDTPGNITRQNFFGSVPPDMGHLDNNGDFNNCWINADQYGAMKLVKEVLVGIDKISNQGKMLKVFPNPVEDILNLEIDPGLKAESYLKMYNAAGNILLSRLTDKENLSISLENYPDGIYFISIVNESDTEVFKILKN